MDTTATMGRTHSMTQSKSEKSNSVYRNLFLTSLIHFAIMYAVMFTMVDQARSIYLNLNNVYMTGMMLAPMTLLMVLTMGMMYPNKKLNLAIGAGSIAIFAILYVFMRQQTFIDDKEFVRSMIPHHSGAILMCNEAKITDPELKTLCQNIVSGQSQEIEQLKNIYSRLKNQ